MKKSVILFFLGVLAGFLLFDVHKYYPLIDSFSGATPKAFDIKVPADFSLRISGKVKTPCVLSGRDFNLLHRHQVRTQETGIDGKLKGTYFYSGIPLYSLIDGIAPLKTDNDVFDKPHDIVVAFISKNGKKSLFSYGELAMKKDSQIPLLAYSRKGLLPDKDPKEYDKNVYSDQLKGFRLICPHDLTDFRYLDDVVEMHFLIPKYPDDLLPEVKKKTDPVSKFIVCIENEKIQNGSFDSMNIRSVDTWFRTGHGRGLKNNEFSKAEGYLLRDFISNNFSEIENNDMFLLVGSDGYRCLFSYEEIKTSDNMLISISIDGNSLKEGFTLAVIDDYFVDRCIRGLSHIAKIQIK